MSRCANCDTDLLAGDVYCSSCGFKVEPETISAASPLDQWSEQEKEVQAAAPASSAAEIEDTDLPGSDAPCTPVEATRSEDPVVVGVESEGAGRPPSASIHDDGERSHQASSEEAEDRLDQAIQEYTKGNISAATLGRIETALQSEAAGARTRQDIEQPEGEGPTRVSHDRVRRPDVVVNLSGGLGIHPNRVTVHKALLAAGYDDDASKYLQETSGVFGDQRLFLDTTRQWVTVQGEGPTRVSHDRVRRPDVVVNLSGGLGIHPNRVTVHKALLAAGYDDDASKYLQETSGVFGDQRLFLDVTRQWVTVQGDAQAESPDQPIYPSTGSAESADVPSVRFPDVKVQLPTGIDTWVVRSKVWQELQAAGHKTESQEFLDTTNGLLYEPEELSSAVRKWVTVEDSPSWIVKPALRDAPTSSPYSPLKRKASSGIAIAAAMVIGIVLAAQGSDGNPDRPQEQPQTQRVVECAALSRVSQDLANPALSAFDLGLRLQAIGDDFSAVGRADSGRELRRVGGEMIAGVAHLNPANGGIVTRLLRLECSGG